MPLRHSPDLAFVEHDDYVVVLNLARLSASSVPENISGTALVVWDAIDGVRDLPAVIAHVAEQFDGADVAADVTAFVADLRDRGLVIDE